MLDESEVSADGSQFVQRLAEHVVGFFGDNPALVVLCLSGGSLDDHGRSIRAAVHELAAGVFANRAPHLADDELHRLGVTSTTVMLSMVREGQRNGSLDGVAEEVARVMGGWIVAYMVSRVSD